MKPGASYYRIPTRYLWVAVAVGLAAILISCGGGGGMAGVGSGGTGATYSGPITGFGSIIVNGVRLDDSAAQITLDDDHSGGGELDLKLGMVVDVEGQLGADGVSGQASRIVTRSLLRGPVSAISDSRVTVLGANVTASARTVFDGAGLAGVSSLKIGDIVEVHGISDPSGNVSATRIERASSSVGPEVRLTGTVEAGPGAADFRINGYTVRYKPAALDGIAGGIKAGLRVRVKGTLSDSTIEASNIRSLQLAPPVKNKQHAEVEGIVTAFTSASRFEVNGVPVAVGTGVKIAGAVALGSQVAVAGEVQDGVLAASKVEAADGASKGGDGDLFELHGPIAAVEAGGRGFTMRGGSIAVQWDENTRFGRLSNAAGLASGQKIVVKGRMNGNVLLASSIDSE